MARLPEICACEEIRQWRVPIDELDPAQPAAAADARLPDDEAASSLSYVWNDSADRADAAVFAGSVIAKSAKDISHGEIQTGLSPDGKKWADDLPQLYAEDFADPGNRDLLVGRDAAEQVCAILIIAWESSGRRRFAVIEDRAVDPALRSRGIGACLLRMADERIRERGIKWVFLESGLGNQEAHSFFERADFALISHVFARRLD